MERQVVQLNFLRMTPRKVRAVGDLIKGLPVIEAEAQLMAQSRRAAWPLLKLLRSAVANAKVNQNANSEKLYVQNLRVDQGPMLKRYLPRARGSASPIQRKMSHVTLVLVENPNLPSPRFKIVIPKKTKLPPEKRPKPGKEKTVRGEEVQPKKKSSGFFKKMFSRKTGMGN